ncbi:hypothetical protein FGIG_00592 [Fasciola gigantica]|uniref:Uncharacterized protein n=1 Tax=Fasciola gigantica TaxID=46835 RepID=A0A504YXY9_FASGI|nr:hypothetical protein FGIG_00592 [Fasciola gigantica]
MAFQALLFFTGKLVFLGGLCFPVKGCEYVRRTTGDCIKKWETLQLYPIGMVQSNTATVTYEYATESVQRKGSLYAGYIVVVWPNKSHWSYYLVGPEILGYNGTWVTNGTTIFHTCCEKTTELLSYNGTLMGIGRIQLGRCCSKFIIF